MRNGTLVVGFAVGFLGCGNGAKTNLEFGNENNFKLDTATSDMTLYQGVVASGQQFCFDWSAMTTDMRGRPLDPTAIDQVLLVEFPYTEDVLITKIVDENDVPQEGTEPWIFENSNGDTYGCTDQMQALGNYIEDATDVIVAQEGRTWMLSLVTLTEGTIEVQQVMRIIPDTAVVDPVDVTFTDGLSSIFLQPVMSDVAIQTVAAADDYTLDWATLTKDVAGKKWNNLKGDRLFVLRYDGTVEDITNDFLLLDYHAAELYKMDAFGVTNADLREAVADDGTPFGGFTTEETWLIGLGCSGCISPVPLAMTVVEAVE